MTSARIMTTIADAQLEFERRGVRVRAFLSGVSWHVLLEGADSNERFAGVSGTLVAAIAAALAHCDLKRGYRQEVR